MPYTSIADAVRAAEAQELTNVTLLLMDDVVGGETLLLTVEHSHTK
jgi:hypothetical protein